MIYASYLYFISALLTHKSYDWLRIISCILLLQLLNTNVFFYIIFFVVLLNALYHLVIMVFGYNVGLIAVIEW